MARGLPSLFRAPWRAVFRRRRADLSHVGPKNRAKVRVHLKTATAGAAATCVPTCSNMRMYLKVPAWWY